MRISKKLQVTRKTEKRRDNVFQWSRVACTTTAPIAPIGLASGNRGLAGLDGGTESVSREKGWEVGGGSHLDHRLSERKSRMRRRRGGT